MLTLKLNIPAPRVFGTPPRWAKPFAGCRLEDIPKEIAQGALKAGVKFPLPPLAFTEAELFQCYRGVVAGMRTRTPHDPSLYELELYVGDCLSPDAIRMSPEDAEAWASDYRILKGIPEPTSRAEHAQEVFSQRPVVDHFDQEAKRAKASQSEDTITQITTAVLAALRGAGA